MKTNLSRRHFIRTAALTSTAAMVPIVSHATTDMKKVKPIPLNTNPLKIGVMTYTLAKDWDIETIIKNLTETGYKSVELRTTHKHGVEVSLSSSQRTEVKNRFKDSALETISLASGFMYHSPDPAELKKNIEGTKEYLLLARDVNATGIRVFGNALPKDVPEEKTMEQIGKSLAEVGEFGHNLGVEVRICIHGQKTDDPVVIKKILDYANSPHVYVNWNCGRMDNAGKGLAYNFNLVKDRLTGVHMHELWEDYPYREFFQLLAGIGFKGYCNAEIDGNADPIRLMKYYKALFLSLQNAV